MKASTMKKTDRYIYFVMYTLYAVSQQSIIMRVNKNPDWIGAVQPDNRIKHVNKMNTNLRGTICTYIAVVPMFN